jgi:hypothetical protein
MPLSSPVPRVPSHTRRVIYQGFAREDGLWDIEGQLHDSKAHDQASLRSPNLGPLPAGAAMHDIWLRVTVDSELIVRAIESAMDAFPMPHCTGAQRALHAMIGCDMMRGWRKAIDTHLGGVAGCTHMRELLFNLATAAIQTVQNFEGKDDKPPRHLGQCTGWDFNGEGVRVHYPKFYGRAPQHSSVAPRLK